MALTVPQNYICGSWNRFFEPYNYCGPVGPFFATGKWSPQTTFMGKEMVFANHINCYCLARPFIVTRKLSAQTLFVTKEMVFANHINFYCLVRLFVVTGKWSY